MEYAANKPAEPVCSTCKQSLQAGGWIEWDEDKSSSSPEGYVEIKQRDGAIKNGEASYFRWGYKNFGDDILAYRVIEKPTVAENATVEKKSDAATVKESLAVGKTEDGWTQVDSKQFSGCVVMEISNWEEVQKELADLRQYKAEAEAEQKLFWRKNNKLMEDVIAFIGSCYFTSSLYQRKGSRIIKRCKAAIVTIPEGE